MLVMSAKTVFYSHRVHIVTLCKTPAFSKTAMVMWFKFKDLPPDIILYCFQIHEIFYFLISWLTESNKPLKHRHQSTAKLIDG